VTATTGAYSIASDLLSWNRDKNEIIVATSSADSDFKGNFKATFDIAFDEIEIVEGKPVIGVLNKLTSIVESILLAIEADSRRLGFVK
jgi:hypothetical protein